MNFEGNDFCVDESFGRLDITDFTETRRKGRCVRRDTYSTLGGILNEPRHEKTCFLGLRPGLAQNELYCRLENLD